MKKENNLAEEISQLKNAETKQVAGFVKKWFVSVQYKNYNYNKDTLVEFWKSSVLIDHFDYFLEAHYFDNILLAYFDHPNNVNPDFLNQLIENDCLDRFIKILKISKGFLMDSHWESLKPIGKRLSLRKTFYELQYIRNLTQAWKKEAVSMHERVLNTSYEDLLIQSLSYYEFFKRYSTKTMENRSQQIAYESHYISVLNDLLTLKKDADQKPSSNNKLKDFQDKVQAELPPIRPLKTLFDETYKPNEKISPVKKEVRKLLDFFIKKEILTYQVENYLCGLSKFEDIDMEDLIAEVSLTKAFYDYRQTLEKGYYEENYFLNQINQNPEIAHQIKNESDSWDQVFALSQEKAIAYFDFLSLPQTLKIKWLEQPIDIRKTFRLLFTFSKLFSPQGRIGSPTEDGMNVFKKSIQDRFKAIFYTEYMVAYDYEDFIQKTAHYFDWTSEEARNTINFLLLDLEDSRKYAVDILSRPIIKMGNKIIWLSSFLRDRRWEILLQKRIATSKVEKYEIKLQTAETEKSIAALFKHAGFEAVASRNYKDNKGEFDTLAFKDNTLFIIELKSTYPEENIIKTHTYESIKFDGLAAYQLERGEQYVRDNFSEILAIPELEINCSLGDLEIKTLIVSNIFQGDNTTYRNKHLKISLLELSIILKNDLSNLFIDWETDATKGNRTSMLLNESIGFFDKALVKQKSIFKKNAVMDFNIQSHAGELSAADFITCIEKKRVWESQRKPFLGDLIKSNLQQWDGSNII